MALTSKFLRPSESSADDSTAETRYTAALKTEIAAALAAGDTVTAKALQAKLAAVGRVVEVETATRAAAPEKAVKRTRKKASTDE